jgi:hypothetical protein
VPHTKKSKTAEAAGTRLRSHSFWALEVVGKTSQAEARTHDDDDKNHTHRAGASAGTSIISFWPGRGAIFLLYLSENQQAALS